MSETRETVGKASYNLWGKKPEAADATEQMREQLDQYDKELLECLEFGKKKYYDDFYLVVITKKERLMPNVMRNYFFSRSTCPTPDYDQTIYRYTKSDDGVEFLWVVPSKQACLYMLNNPLEIQEKELLGFVLDYSDGTLMKKALQLNKEIEG
jgi:hypothetical protein